MINNLVKKVLLINTFLLIKNWGRALLEIILLMLTKNEILQDIKKVLGIFPLGFLNV